MSNDTETRPADSAEGPRTSGYIQRTVLHHMAGSSYEPYTPSTVGGVAEAVADVIERGDYANAGPRADAGIARRSTIRRALNQLEERGLIRRVEDLTADELAGDRIDLGAREGDAGDVTDYERVTDDARVTDWILTDAGRDEVARLDAAYEAELDALAAKYGRRRGETTRRIEA